MCNFLCCDCHPGVLNKLLTVNTARYSLTIHCSFSSMLSLVKHMLQDVNCLAQNCTCKHPLKPCGRSLRYLPVNELMTRL